MPYYYCYYEYYIFIMNIMYLRQFSKRNNECMMWGWTQVFWGNVSSKYSRNASNCLPYIIVKGRGKIIHLVNSVHSSKRLPVNYFFSPDFTWLWRWSKSRWKLLPKSNAVIVGRLIWLRILIRAFIGEHYLQNVFQFSISSD